MGYWFWEDVFLAVYQLFWNSYANENSKELLDDFLTFLLDFYLSIDEKHVIKTLCIQYNKAQMFSHICIFINMKYVYMFAGQTAGPNF